MGTGIAIFFGREAIFSIPTDKGIDTDVGFETDAEKYAVRALADFNAKTGELAGDSVVRLILRDPQNPYIFGWINPHFHDPIAVRLFQDNTNQWAFTDSPDEPLEGFKWRYDFLANRLAEDVLNILQDHKAKIFRSLPTDIRKNPKLIK